jgi:GTPase
MDASALYSNSLNRAPEKGYRALLIGTYGLNRRNDQRSQHLSLQELFRLCDTAGVRNMFHHFMQVASPDPKIYFHKGNLNKIMESINRGGINLLVVDANLKPNQLRNLEETLKVRVLGRIELILDIFAMRARSKPAALQVELAQLTYILPRLKGLGGVLSRQGGGIGSRGPGETMLETDRRHIRRRIEKIKKEMASQERHRENTRKNRILPRFAIVGYTNAGKSTLINELSNTPKKVLAEDRLFATLDSFSRQVYLGSADYRPIRSIITDTVGFIRNLPASVVAAFQATLEEIRHTDAIILVLDSSSPQMNEEYDIVLQELERLEIVEQRILLFMNKSDLLFKEQREQLERRFPEAIWGSAKEKKGAEDLRRALFDFVSNELREEWQYESRSEKETPV